MTVPLLNQLTLGRLIMLLERLDPSKKVRYDFVHFFPTSFGSYLGYYEDLALGYTNNYDARQPPTVSSLLAACRLEVGRVHEGYKGGSYTMTTDTPIWVANYSEAGGTAIVGVEQRLYATLITAKVE